ncbi:TetR/AcrR family transcriptional regulator [Bosea thiooxidans]
MSRIVKQPDIRRSELLDCAQALFFERGYENTTVNEIIAKAGVSKGGFYHHYPSKEAVLEALAVRLAEQAVERIEDARADSGLDALARLNAFLARARRLKLDDAPRLRAAFDAVFRPENIVLYHRINTASIKVMLPVLVRILAQGQAEGVFKVPDVEAAAEIVLHLGVSTHDAVARAIKASGTDDEDAAIEALDRRLRFHGLVVDRILGLPDGSIQYVEPGFTRAVMTAR